jgi:hypothetical protein
MHNGRLVKMLTELKMRSSILRHPGNSFFAGHQISPLSFRIDFASWPENCK